MDEREVLERDRIHSLVGEQFFWTDELWNTVDAALRDCTSQDDASAMLAYIGDNEEDLRLLGSDALAFLEGFSRYPTTVFLGAYDLMRHRRALAQYFDHLRVIGISGCAN